MWESPPSNCKLQGIHLWSILNLILLFSANLLPFHPQRRRRRQSELSIRLSDKWNDSLQYNTYGDDGLFNHWWWWTNVRGVPQEVVRIHQRSCIILLLQGQCVFGSDKSSGIAFLFIKSWKSNWAWNYDRGRASQGLISIFYLTFNTKTCNGYKMNSVQCQPENWKNWKNQAAYLILCHNFTPDNFF